MKRACLVFCSIAVVVILLQANVIDSRRSGSSRSSSSRSRSGTSSSHSTTSQRGSYSQSSKSVGSVSKSGHKPDQSIFSSSSRNAHKTLKHGGGSSLGQYNTKPWKPKQPKMKLKHVAGAAVAGAAVGVVGGILVGRAMYSMHFHFRSPEEENWWYKNRDYYSDRVYFPNYEGQTVPKEIFVKDCVNVTVREFVEPHGNQTANEMEARVVTQVVHQMCTEEYRHSFSQQAEGDRVWKMSRETERAVATGVGGRPNRGYGPAVGLRVSFLIMASFLTNLLCY